MRVASVCAILLVVIWLNGRTSAQIPEGYEVVVLANDLGIHSRPEINNRSEVVWSSSFPPDVSDVWLYSDGVIRKISDGGGYDISPSINNNSIVTWRRCESYFDIDCDLVVWQDGAITAVETPFSLQGTVVINDANQIVWVHDFSGTFDDVELFLTEQGATFQITDDDLSNQGPRMNSAGDIVWTRIDFGVSPFTTSFFLYSDGIVTQLADEGTHPGIGDVNDAGQVTWGSKNGIELWDNGEITVIVAGGGSPKINESQHISFARYNQEAERNEVWLQKNGALYLLSDTQFSAAASAINDQDEVAWRQLDTVTGDTAIFVMRRVASMGDFDGDSYVDMRDARAMQLCLAEDNETSNEGLLGDCSRGDFDGDDDVDLQDFESFQDAITGPGEPVPGSVP